MTERRTISRFKGDGITLNESEDLIKTAIPPPWPKQSLQRQVRDLIVRNVRNNEDSEMQTISGKEEEHIRTRLSTLGRRLLVLKCKIFNELDLKEREVDLIELTIEV